MLTLKDGPSKKLNDEASRILSYITEQIINIFCNINRSLRIQLSSKNQADIAFSSMFFQSDISDANKQLPDVIEPNFYPSLIQQALTSNPEFDKNQEHRQFYADINRHSVVKNEGLPVSADQKSQLLEAWSQELANKSGLPLETIKYAISTLHQGVGNNAVAFLKNLETIKDGQRVVFYRPLMHSNQFHSSLNKFGRNISMQYVVPIQLVTEEEQEGLDNQGRTELLIISTVNIRFNENYMQQSDSVSHSVQIQPTTAGVTVQYDQAKYAAFDFNNRLDDFVIVETPNLIADAEHEQQNNSTLKLNS